MRAPFARGDTDLVIGVDQRKLLAFSQGRRLVARANEQESHAHSLTDRRHALDVDRSQKQVRGMIR